jgi:hypothetical protein
VVTGQLRDACIVLAGQALQAAGGDEDEAKAALPDALEAIGALPYQSAAKYHWGATG